MTVSKAYNSDSLAAMRLMSDNAFELAIVDPPYGINRGGQTETFTKNAKHKRKFFTQKGWDSHIPNAEYFQELRRVSVNQIIWGANYFTEHLPACMGWVFWDKGQDLSMSDGELAFTSFQRALRRIVINRGQLVLEGGTIHPTQKPVKLYTWLLQTYAKPGDRILDTHLGSGSSRIAAHILGFDFEGYELDKDYFDAQEERFKNHSAQVSLFDSVPVEAETLAQTSLFG